MKGTGKGMWVTVIEHFLYMGDIVIMTPIEYWLIFTDCFSGKGRKHCLLFSKSLASFAVSFANPLADKGPVLLVWQNITQEPGNRFLLTLCVCRI